MAHSEQPKEHSIKGVTEVCLGEDCKICKERTTAQEEGYNDFYKGKEPTDSPYERGTREHEFWQAGYITADAYELGEGN